MKTVLVVEDSEDLRELFMEVLRQDGYRVLGAEHGQEALEVLRSCGTEPCLILLDMMMPVMDGQMFLNALDQTKRVAPLPIVVVSAGITEQGVRGATRFVKKPVAPIVLTTMVREYCGPP
jgi:two-component system chemotaxis response regulator CheY